MHSVRPDSACLGTSDYISVIIVRIIFYSFSFKNTGIIIIIQFEIISSLKTEISVWIHKVIHRSNKCKHANH